MQFALHGSSLGFDWDLSFAVDIQDFYELTLLDDNKSPHDKTVATMKLAEQWTDTPTSNGTAYEVSSCPLYDGNPCALLAETLPCFYFQ